MQSSILNTDKLSPTTHPELGELLHCNLKWGMASEEHARGRQGGGDQRDHDVKVHIRLKARKLPERN